MRNLILLTDNYPFGSSEQSFIEPELLFLTKEYNVHVIAKRMVGKRIDCDFPNCMCKSMEYKKYYFFCLCKCFFQKELYKEIGFIKKNKKKNIFRNILTAIWYLTMANIANANIYKLMENNSEPCIIYAFWSDWVALGAVLYNKIRKNVRVVVRTHNVDLYEERVERCYQPYKQQMDECVAMMLFVSDVGKRYYIDTYTNGNCKQKNVNYLGTRKGKFPINRADKDKGKTLHLVSCSGICPVKRIELIIDSLSLLNKCKVKWTHIGAGWGDDYEKRLKSKIRKLENGKGNIEINMIGFLPNEEVHEFYKHNMIDCFLSTSQMEGLPVSMMEAASYGIPIIATDVGGVREIVSNENGILLSDNPSAAEIAEAIMSFYSMDEKARNSLRIGSYNKWCQYFDFEKNKRELLRYLDSVYNEIKGEC